MKVITGTRRALCVIAEKQQIQNVYSLVCHDRRLTCDVVVVVVDCRNLQVL